MEDVEDVEPEPVEEPLDADDRALLALLATGCSASEAAEAHHLSITEVARRLAAVRTRLGVTSTRAAIQLAMRPDVGGASER